MELKKIEAAVAALEESGRDVTVRSVREVLGGGSMTDVAAGLKAHRETRRMADDIEREIPPKLLETLNGILVQVWSTVASEHSKRLEMVQRGAASAASESDAALQELSKYVDELTLELECMKEESSNTEAELAVYRSELDEKEKKLAVAESRFKDLKEQLRDARERENALIQALRRPDFLGRPAETAERSPTTRPLSSPRNTFEQEQEKADSVASLQASEPDLSDHQIGAAEVVNLEKPWSAETKSAGLSVIEAAIEKNGPISVLQLRDLETEFAGSDLINLRDFVQQLAKQFNKFTMDHDGKIILLAESVEKAGDDHGH